MADKIMGYEESALARALVRRFGASTMPLACRVVKDSGIGPRIIRCTDPETGSWIEADMARRLRVVAEHDANA